MKYSVRGRLNIDSENEAVNLLNDYTLWRLITDKYKDKSTLEEVFTFEVWLISEEDKDDLFRKLKPLVDRRGFDVNWHECTHDEESPKPCIIAEEYRM